MPSRIAVLFVLFLSLIASPILAQNTTPTPMPKPTTPAEEHYQNGMLAKGKFDYQTAITEFKEAIDLNENYAEAHYQLALVYRAQGEIDQSLEQVNRAIEVNPAYYEAYIYRAGFYISNGDYDKGFADYDHALKI